MFDAKILNEINGGLLLSDRNPILSLAPLVMGDTCSVVKPVPLLASTDSINSEQPKTYGIKLIGVMTKYGVSQYVAKAMRELADDGAKNIILLIDSPGGTCSAVAPLLDAIRYTQSLGVKVYASVDCCCSAAYWVASACDGIYADNAINSRIGSIGVYSRYVNTDLLMAKLGVSVTDFYATQSTLKNDITRKLEQGDSSLLVSEISRTAQLFIDDVKRNRSIKDSDGVFEGQIFSPIKAKELGLIDGVASLFELLLLLDI